MDMYEVGAIVYNAAHFADKKGAYETARMLYRNAKSILSEVANDTANDEDKLLHKKAVGLYNEIAEKLKAIKSKATGDNDGRA